MSIPENYNPYDYVDNLPTRKSRNAKGRPQPNISIVCPQPTCRSPDKAPRSTKDAPKDFFWRYFQCKTCDNNYWVGVHHETGLTVITVGTPKVEPYTLLTGNLRFILPAGHPALQLDNYNRFLRTGMLSDEDKNAILDEREAATRAADAADRAARGEPEPTMQVSEEPTTPNPEITSISNDEAIDAAYHDFLEELEAKSIKPQYDQIMPLFNAWLAHFHPELQTKEENT